MSRAESDPGATSAARRVSRAWLALMLCVAAIAAYVPALSGGFLWDDDSYVSANPAVTGPDGWSSIWTLERDESTGAWVSRTPQYYPLVFTSFRLEHALWGLDPLGYHVTNLVLHLAAAGLLYVLLLRLAVPGAGVAAALFALHPMHVESVAWITERKNVLSAVFYLGAFLAFLRFDSTRSKRAYVVGFAAFVAALLSKSVTATLPVALVLAIVWKRRKITARDWAAIAPFLLVGALSGAFTAHLERVKVGADGAEFDLSLVERALVVAPRAFLHYAQHAAFPHPVTFVYERFEPRAASAVAFVPLSIVVLATGVLFALRRRLGLGPLLLVLYSAATLAPALGFVPVFPHRFSWVADHFAYLGSIGFLVLIVLAGRALAGALAPPRAKHGALLAASLVALAPCAWRTRVEARSYASAERLWTDTLRETPSAWIAMINLGIEWMRARPLTAERAARALELFQRAERDPLGAVQGATNQGQWHLGAGQVDEAIACFRRARARDGRHEPARRGLVTVLARRIEARFAAGSSREALGEVRQAILECGADPLLVRWSAWIECTSGDAAVRDAAHALKLARELARLAPADAEVVDVLAAAEAASGDFAAARATATRALELARAARREDLATAIAARLEVYRAGRSLSLPAR